MKNQYIYFSILIFSTIFITPLYSQSDRSQLEQDMFGTAPDRSDLEQDMFGTAPDQSYENMDTEETNSELENISDRDAFEQQMFSGQPDNQFNDNSQPERDTIINWDMLDDTLDIGGDLYTKFTYNILSEDEISYFLLPISLDQYSFGYSNSLYLYLDARPYDHLRAFVRGVLIFNPTIDEDATGTSSLFSGYSGSSQDIVEVGLDELWIKFDLFDYLFFTVGKQKVKWGTGTFWNPTDFINQEKIDPFAVWDERAGISGLKLHIPVEKYGLNFYLIGTIDDTRDFNEITGYARFEFVVSTAEIAIHSRFKNNERTKFGVNLTAGVYVFDVFAEWAFYYAPVPVMYEHDDPLNALPETITAIYDPEDKKLINSLVGGFSYSFNITDLTSLSIQVEYFYNQFGYDDTSNLMASIIAEQTMQVLYMGVHYLALYFYLPTPENLDSTTFIFSTVANLSDYSALSALQVSTRLVDGLTLNFSTMFYYPINGFSNEDKTYPGELRMMYNLLNFNLTLSMRI